MFADGWPGGGLLAQRLLTGGALVYCGVACATTNPICAAVVPESIGALAGVLLIAGLWTPITGAVVAILEASLAFLSPANAALPVFLAVLGATLAMIGPVADRCVGVRQEAHCSARSISSSVASRDPLKVVPAIPIIQPIRRMTK